MLGALGPDARGQAVHGYSPPNRSCLCARWRRLDRVSPKPSRRLHADRGYFRPGAFVGSRGQALGRLLALLGRPAAAEDAYRRALAWSARIGSRLGELDTRVDLACLGHAPDRAELERVREEASTLGLRWIAERAERAAASRDSKRTTPTNCPSSVMP